MCQSKSFAHWQLTQRRDRIVRDTSSIVDTWVNDLSVPRAPYTQLLDPPADFHIQLLLLCGRRLQHTACPVQTVKSTHVFLWRIDSCD